MKNIFTDHPSQTDNPQTYWQHGYFAFINSCILLFGAILGIIHAFCPWWFPFRTSTIVIKCFKKIVDSGRHKEELKEIMPEGYIDSKHME